ncbi:hypothetical protein ElyMa_000794000 [Elysia marginata]|uniref:PAS domain-containing protein n=1 Tax=Elysia marginata TaxID=1093978 RepID=A0AAV4GVL4_9GAST|nr:hypothetical protein ElyMa_000794000 [Elysia marginata]
MAQHQPTDHGHGRPKSSTDGVRPSAPSTHASAHASAEADAVETPSEGLLMPGTSQDRSGSVMKQTIMHQVLPQPVYLMHTSEGFVLNLNNALEAFARMSQTASQPASVLQTAAHPAPAAAHPDAHAHPTFAPSQADPMMEEAFKRTRMRQRVKEEERKNQRRISFNICQISATLSG